MSRRDSVGSPQPITNMTTLCDKSRLGARKKAGLEQLHVLDVHAFSTNQAASMAKQFDELADSSFERLPAMVDCPTRSKLDDGLAEILDLPDLPPPLRRLLTSEPVVSKQRL